MDYRIARDGDTFGPYTEPELRTHLATGHIIPTDLARTDAMDEWLPVSTLFPPAPPNLARTFPSPPNLPWWVALLLGLVTLNVFLVIWDIFEALWMLRVSGRKRAFVLYVASAIFFLIKLPQTWHTVQFNLGLGLRPDDTFPVFFLILTVVLGIASRLVLRSDLLHHFNRTEPIGLHLSWLLTLLFGGLYFQYHFNRINETKRALRQVIPAPS